jgi:hypothetical protein
MLKVRGGFSPRADLEPAGIRAETWLPLVSRFDPPFHRAAGAKVARGPSN